MGKGKKSVMGRPAHEPTEQTRAMVEILSAAGLTQAQIAKKMRFSVDSLMRHYKHEVENGWATGMLDASMVVFSEMRSKDSEKRLDAAKFFLSRRSRGLWSDVKQHEVTGINGAQIQVSVDLDALGYEELQQLDQLLAPAIIEGEIVDADADTDADE